MKLKNVLIVVNDLERSKAFYKQLFGLDIILNRDGNVILTEGLVLQDAKIWEELLQREIYKYSHTSELYFEEKNMEEFVKKLENYEETIQYINPLTQYSWGQKVVRFYDPDGNVIEVATPMETGKHI